jgi:Conjugal transfer/entry exclusion protein
MLKNSKLLPGQVFGTISNDLNALASIVQGGQALSYSLANLDSLFKARFPGYGYSSTGYYVRYRNWSQTSLDTTLGAFARPVCRGSNSRVNSPCSIPCGRWPNRQTGEWKPFR